MITRVQRTALAGRIDHDGRRTDEPDPKVTVSCSRCGGEVTPGGRCAKGRDLQGRVQRFDGADTGAE